MPSSHCGLWPLPSPAHEAHRVVLVVVVCAMPSAVHPQAADGEGAGPEGLPAAATPTMEAALH